MTNITTSFRIAHKEGADLGYYTDKEEFLKNVKGVEEGIFNIESLNVGDVFRHIDQELKIADISVEFQGILDGVDARIDLNIKDNISKVIIVVVIFIEYI